MDYAIIQILLTIYSDYVYGKTLRFIYSNCKCFRFTQRAPSAFFQSSICRPLIECALVALSIDHHDANESVTKFFISTIDTLIDANKV